MYSLKFNFVRIAFACLLLAVGFASTASAVPSQFQILLNLDNNVSTGCDVPTLTGTFPGVEQILITTVNTTGSSASVTAVETRACTAPPSTFGPATPIPAVPGHPLPWTVGVSNGTGGTSVIETFYPLSVAPVGPSPIVRLAVLGFDGGGTLVDEVLTSQPGPGNGPPILMQIQGVTIGEIPTLSEWGLILLALLLAGMAVVLMKRRTRAAFLVALLLLCGAGLAWAAACDLDGSTLGEWLPSSLLASEPTSDAAAGADIRAFYGCPDGGLNGLCFRIDAELLFDDPPSVTTVTPANGATAVPVDSNITVNFNENVNVTASTFSLECPVGAPVTFTVTPAPPGGTNSFTLDPTANLPAGVTCTLRVTAAQVMDTDADDPPDQMALDFTSTFTTDGAPEVSSTNPANGATGIALNQDVAITFNKAVNVTGNWFQIVCSVSGTRNVADTVVSGGPTTFTINPNADFAVGDNCTATVFAAQVTDQDANDPPDNMAANYVFTFAADTPPAVTTTAPANGATGVGTSTNFTINFNENVDVAGNWFQIVCTTSGMRNVADTVVVGGPASFTIDPNVDFTAGESCTVTVVAAQVTDQDAGDPPNNMAADYVFTFTLDTAPSVSATTPANGGTATPASDLTVTFNEPVDVTGNWFQIVCSISGTRNVADTVVTGGPTIFTINPNTDFAGGDDCAVTVVAAQVTDQDAGDPPNNMAADYVFSFTADAAPFVSATVPANNATNVADNTDLTITFSEAVNVTGNWFQIVCTVSGTRNVADTAVSGGPTTFTVNPNTDFAAGEGCTVTVFAAQVADQDANDPPDNMAADHVFSYTIQDVAPTVTATVPVNGATAATDGNLTITFSEAVNVTGNWFQIVCTVTGTRNVVDTAVSGGPTAFTINPNVDFAAGESCTVTVFAAQVADQDVTDPPDNMAADYVFSYTTDGAPAVSATTPADGALNQPTNTDVTITFNEAVNVTGNWFQIVCTVTGTRNVADTAVSGGPTTFTVNPNVDFTQGESCTLTVFAAQVADQDANDPPDNMQANFTATFGMDAAPAVSSTVPVNGATNASTNMDVTVSFSEPVNVAGNWFQIVCSLSGTRNVADTVVSGGPMSFTVNPNTDLTPGESCTLTVFAAQVTDQDLADPPDNMAANHVVTFAADSAPTVTATVPVNGALGAAPNTDLTITFSEAVNVTGNWFQIVCTVSGTRNVADTVVSGGPTTFTINPNADFVGNESCTVTVFAAQVEDQDLADPPNNMAANYVFSYQTDAPPSVTASTPPDSATDQPTNTNLTVTFSEAVNVTGNWFQIVCASSGTRNVADTVVSGGPMVFTINPNVDFATNESCTLTVFAAQVTDQDANDPPDNMQANYTATFSTDAAPAVLNTTPTGADQPSNTNLTVMFSEGVNLAGNWIQVVCSVSGTRNAADTAVTGGPTLFTVNPNVDFTPGESCTATVFAAQVSDQDANDPPDNPVANYVWNFSIDAQPTVTATTPTNGATQVAIDTNLSVTFSEAVNVAGNWFQIVCATSGTRNVADTAVSGGPTTFTINPNVDFAANELCTVTVDATLVSDQDANDPPDTLAANYVFSYTTDAAPFVSSTTPANGAIDQANNTNVTITFNEAVNVAGNWFQISCTTSGLRNVADTVVSGGPTVFTINPNADFVGNETCTVTVSAAQVTDQDLSDPPNNMVADYVFSFSIINTPPVANPDGWEFIGNTQLHVSNAATLTDPHVFVNGDVLANDVDNDGPAPKSVSGIVGCADVTAPFVCPTANGGSVTMEATGRFIYSAKEGDTNAADSFQYTVTDGLASANGTVTLNRKERVWFVRNNAAAGGLGRSHDPFDTLAEAQTASLANDYIFVYFGDGAATGQAAGIVLKNGQHLIGQHAGLTVTVPGPGTFNGTPLPTSVSLVPAAPGNRPLVENPAAGGSAVSATNAVPVEIIGLSLQSTNANAVDLTNAVALPASAVLSIQDNVIRGAGAEGIDVNLNAGTTGTLTLNFTGNTWNLAGTHTGNGFDARTAAAAANLRINFSNNTNILSTGAGASGVFIDGSGGGTVTITGFANNSVHQNTVGNGMLITSATFDATPGGAYNTVSGGTTVIGTSGDGVGGSGISMSNVSGDLAFTDLDIFADGGQGLRVAGTGAVNTGAGTGTRVTVGAGVAIFEATGGPAVDVSNATVDLQPTSIRSTNSPTTGVALNTVNGTFSAGSGSTISGITSAAGTAFQVSGSNATVSYAGTITSTIGTGVSLTSNTGSTIGFTGTLTLSTGTNPAFVATGGGTVTSTDTASTLTTTTGTALNVANTTIGAGGLHFRSISANGGANGIVLDNTGSSGGLTVPGTGSAGTGGTIRNMTGADGAVAGTGIYLNNTRNVSLAWMQLNDFQNFAIRGQNVVGFSLTNSTVNGVNGNNDAANEGSISFDELTGSATLTNVSVSGGWEDNVRLSNTTGTLNRLTMTNCTVGANSASFGNSALNLMASGTATVNVTVTGGTFTGSRSHHIQYLLNGAATPSGDLVLTSNNFTQSMAAVAGAGNIFVSSGGNGNPTLTYNIQNNTMRNAVGNAINVSKGAGTGNFNGTIDNNTVGVAGVANSGSSQGNGIVIIHVGGGTHTTHITNNTVRRYNNDGILVQVGDNTSGGNGTVNATITGNVVKEPDSFALHGLELNIGTTAGDSHFVCASIGGAGALRNDMTGSSVVANGGFELRPRQRQSTTIRLPGYGGGPTDTAAVATFLAGQNTTSGVGSISASAASNGFVNGAACP